MSTEPDSRADGGVIMRRTALAERVAGLAAPQVDLVAEFVDQILRCHDPDAVATFLRWRRDPRLETLLLIAAGLDDDALDQLVFAAEDLQDDRLLRDPAPLRGPGPFQRR